MSDKPLVTLLDLVRNGRYREALHSLDELLSSPHECPYLLNLRATLLQVGAWPERTDPIGEAETALLSSYAIDEGNLDTLLELAHFYDSMKPDREKALVFAQRCEAKASRLLAEVQTVTSDDIDKGVGDVLSRLPRE